MDEQHLEDPEDVVLACHADVIAAIERWLPLVPTDKPERDMLATAVDSLRSVLPAATSPQTRREVATVIQRSDSWLRTPSTERREAIVDVLGEDRLTLKEIAERLEASRPGWRLWNAAVRAMVMPMVQDGKLARESELTRPRTGRGTLRYRCSRPRPLQGEIAELERRLDDDAPEPT